MKRMRHLAKLGCIAGVIALASAMSSAAPVRFSANGHWYEIVSDEMTWGEAREAAAQRTYRGRAGHLATISSDEENIFIFDTLIRPSGLASYIGGFQPPGSPEPDGGWRWVTDEPFAYSHWNPRLGGVFPPEPNNLGGDEDTIDVPGNNNGWWNDTSGVDVQSAYIVEYEPSLLLGISATHLNTTFSPNGGTYDNGVLTVSDAADIVLEHDDGQVTLPGGSLFLSTSLFMDLTDLGPASALFAGGTLVVKDGDNADLLTADVVDMRLDEVYDSAGILAGKGLFEVTGGSLEEDFGMPYGEIVQITFHLNPGGIADFSTAFTGVSNVTLMPIPEPATLLLVGTGVLGIVSMMRRRQLRN